MAGTVRYELEGACLRVVLDHPAKRNALGLSMLRELRLAAERAAQDDVAVVALSGAGGAFCAGGNLDEMTEGDPAQAMARMEAEMEGAMAALAAIQVPVVALIDGACYGAGVQLALCADLRIAGSAAKFAIPAAKFGIVYPPAAITELVRVAGPGRAATVLLLAEPFDAARALELGVVEEVTPADAFAVRSAAVLTALAGFSRDVAIAHKALIRGAAAGAPPAELAQIHARSRERGAYLKGLAAEGARRRGG